MKANLIITHDQDDALLKHMITAAVSYAETFQGAPEGSYKDKPIRPTTEQAVIMLASNFYQSRDGSTAGFYGDNAQAGQQVWNTVNMLLRMHKKWRV